MTILSRITLLLFITFSMAGCFSDDGLDRASIQYRVTTEVPMAAHITYRTAGGQLMATDMLPDATLWHATEYVDEAFEALLQASFSNSSGSEISYTLHLFFNGELVAKKQGTVPANSSAAAQVSHVAR